MAKTNGNGGGSDIITEMYAEISEAKQNIGLLAGYRMLGGVIAVYVAFAAAHSLAKKYELDPMACGLLSMAAFFVAAWPVHGVPPSPPAIPTARLGAGSIFAALFLAIATVE